MAALFTSANAVARKASSIQIIKSLVSHPFLAFVRSMRFTAAAATKNRRELRNVSLREIPVSRVSMIGNSFYTSNVRIYCHPFQQGRKSPLSCSLIPRSWLGSSDLEGWGVAQRATGRFLL